MKEKKGIVTGKELQHEEQKRNIEYGLKNTK